MISVFTAGKSGEMVVNHLLNEGWYQHQITIYDDYNGGKLIRGITIRPNLLNGINEYYVIATSNMNLRRSLYDYYKGHGVFMNINYGEAEPTTLKQGNIIFSGVIFEKFSEVGSNNVISSGTIVNHHCKIGNGNLLGPGCLLSGSVTIGNNCDIGSGVIFEPGVTVADNTTIPSGAIIVGDVSGHIMASRRGAIYTGGYRI